MDGPLERDWLSSWTLFYKQDSAATASLHTSSFISVWLSPNGGFSLFVRLLPSCHFPALSLFLYSTAPKLNAHFAINLPSFSCSLCFPPVVPQLKLSQTRKTYNVSKPSRREESQSAFKTLPPLHSLNVSESPSLAICHLLHRRMEQHVRWISFFFCLVFLSTRYDASGCRISGHVSSVILSAQLTGVVCLDNEADVRSCL